MSAQRKDRAMGTGMDFAEAAGTPDFYAVGRLRARVAELEVEVNLLHRQRHAAQEDAANARLLAEVRQLSQGEIDRLRAELAALRGQVGGVVPELMIESHDPSDIPEGRSARWVKDPDRENGGYWAYPAVPMEELEALRSLYSWMSAADEGGVKVSFSLTEFPEGQTCLSGIANALAALDALRAGEAGKGGAT